MMWGILAVGASANGKMLPHMGFPRWHALAGVTKSFPCSCNNLDALVDFALRVSRAWDKGFCHSDLTSGNILMVATLPVNPRMLSLLILEEAALKRSC